MTRLNTGLETWKMIESRINKMWFSDYKNLDDNTKESVRA